MCISGHLLQLSLVGFAPHSGAVKWECLSGGVFPLVHVCSCVWPVLPGSSKTSQTRSPILVRGLSLIQQLCPNLEVEVAGSRLKLALPAHNPVCGQRSGAHRWCSGCAQLVYQKLVSIADSNGPRVCSISSSSLARWLCFVVRVQMSGGQMMSSNRDWLSEAGCINGGWLLLCGFVS